jgi:hypothetical protein
MKLISTLSNPLLTLISSPLRLLQMEMSVGHGTKYGIHTCGRQKIEKQGWSLAPNCVFIGRYSRTEPYPCRYREAGYLSPSSTLLIPTIRLLFISVG